MYFRIGVLMTFQMSKIKSVILGVRVWAISEYWHQFMSSTSFCLRRLSKLFCLRGHWTIKARNSRLKSRYHKCLWTIYNVRRISSSNSINDNERNGLKWASFICQKRNHFLVCLRIDLMCCSDVTEIWSVIQQKQKFFSRTKK